MDAHDFNKEAIKNDETAGIRTSLDKTDDIGRLKLEKIHKDTAYSNCLRKLYNLGKKNLNDVDTDDIASIITEAKKNEWKEIEDTAFILLKARNNYYEYYCNLGTDLCLDMSDYNSKAYLGQYINYLDSILINCNDFIQSYSIDNELDAKEEFSTYITEKLRFLIDTLNNL